MDVKCTRCDRPKELDRECEWCSTSVKTGTLYPPKPKSALDIQVGGSHYKDMKIQPVEFVTVNGLGFIVGNVIKYLCRYKFKNGIEDLKKTKHYIDLLIDLETKAEDKPLCGGGSEC